MRFRQMKPKDVATVHRLGKKIPGFDVSSSTVGFWSKETLMRWCKSRNDLLLVAEEDTIVGFAFFACHRATRKATWENVWVSPDYRRRNIARQLTSKAFNILAKRGYRIVAALVQVENLEALGFFNRCGLRQGKPCHWFDLPLSPAR